MGLNKLIWTAHEQGDGTMCQSAYRVEQMIIEERIRNYVSKSPPKREITGDLFAGMSEK